MTQILKNKKLTRSTALAIPLLAIIVVAELAKINQLNIFGDSDNNNILMTDKDIYDVNEAVKFTWTTNVEYMFGLLIYGDGGQPHPFSSDDDEFEKTEGYQKEGTYNVLLIFYDETSTQILTLSKEIHIKNDPPQIEVIIPETAKEDQPVNVGVNILDESDHDKIDGLLTYIYDFSDGTQNTTTSDNIDHIWTTAGIYPVTITAIDDQGAIDQVTKHINITNVNPTAKFTLGAEIPATFSFSEDIVNSLPFGWETGPFYSRQSFYVVETKDSRAKILKCIAKAPQHNTENYIDMYVGEQSSGTIEYQFMTNNITDAVGYMAIKTRNTELIAISTKDDIWKYRLNGLSGLNNDIYPIPGLNDLDPPENNEWYHIRIDFCTDNSKYFGLEENQFQIIINGKISEKIENGEGDPIEYISIGNYYKALGESYIDSIGLSWDENYNVGDNYHVYESSYYGTYDFRDDIIGSEPKEWSVNETAPSDISVVNMGEDYKEVIKLDDKSNEEALWIENSHNLYCEEFEYTQLVNEIIIKDEGGLYPSGSAESTYKKDGIYYTIHSDPTSRYSEVWIHLKFDKNFILHDLYKITVCFYITGYSFDNDFEYWILSENEDELLYREIPGGFIDVTVDQDIFTDDLSGNTITLRTKANDEWATSAHILHVDALSVDGNSQYDVFSQGNGFLRSPNDINLDLEPNDKIEIAFKESISNEINLNLRKDNKTVRNFVLSEQGNTDNQKRVKVFTIDDYIIIDQLEFTGISDDRKDLIIGHIRIYRSLTQNISSGTIEFYARSENVNAKTWALTLFNDLGTACSIMMNDEKWMYSSGDSQLYEITGCGLPISNQWHHIRIDFTLDTSEYQNLNQHQFAVIIDDIKSNQIYTSNLNINEINKIRFESGLSDIGIAYIDAIGYSWDERYQIDDNKISVVLYPEKTSIQFSAEDTVDTESDLDSLRYYWDFGDGLTGFGKYIKHDYLTSGRYNVTLHVKDDNGALGSTSKLVLVFNLPPKIDLETKSTPIIINEGDTVIARGYSTDDPIDEPLLGYLWNFEATEFNQYYLSTYESGSIQMSHIYEDDFDGQIIGMVRDPEGLFDWDSVDVQVNNIDPSISIYDAGILANISLEVLGSSIDKAGNFTIKLVSDEKTTNWDFASFLGYIGNRSVSNGTISFMSLSKNWKIVVEALEQLPEDSWFQYFVKIDYFNGQELIIDSGVINGGSYGNWSVDLNQFWYDPENFTFKVPLTLNYSIWDPSVDDIDLTIQYNVDMKVKLSCSNNLPITTTFTINYPTGDVIYTINVYESNGEIYADITASQLILSKQYNENNFPISIKDSFTLHPIIDLDLLFNNYLGLIDYTLIQCEMANNSINALINDDDGGTNHLNIEFETKKYIDFINLCPQVEPFIPVTGSMNTEILFNIQINDFDQLHPSHNFDGLTYQSNSFPKVPIDFKMINGTIIESGDLYFADDDSIVFSSEGYSSINTAFEDNFNDAIRDPNWIDEKNFGKIIEEDDVLKLKANALSYWGDFLCWNLSWAPYSIVPIPDKTISNWEVQVNVSNPYGEFFGYSYDPYCFLPNIKRHHYGLVLYQDDENTWLFGPTGDGSIQVDKIVEGDLEFVTKINSSDNFLRIRKANNIYCFEYSKNGTNWISLYETLIIEIEPSFVGVFHKAWLTWPLWVDFDDFKLIEGTSEYALNFISNLNFDEYVDNDRLLESIQLITSYSTDVDQLVSLSIYNFASNMWTLIDSSTISTDYHDIIWNLASSDYYNTDHDILIKFEAYNKLEQFNLSLDLLKIECKWYIPPVYSIYEEDPYSSENSPNSFDDDFTFTAGIPIYLGDLFEQDFDYSIVNSSQYQLDFTVKLKMEDAEFFDRIDSLDLRYSYSTDISQLISLSIYNYTSDEWLVIDSSVHIQFFNGLFNIPVLKISDFINSDLEILVKFEGTNDTEDFQLFLDMLKIQYILTPYRFISNSPESLLYYYMDGYKYNIESLNYSDELSSEYSYMYYGGLYFNCTGEYLVTIMANDGLMITKESRVINIINPDPYAKIGHFPNITDADTTIEFTAEIFGIDNSTDDLRFVWSFGDGTYAFEQSPSHAWSTSGIYEISLLVVDQYGNMYKDTKNITIQNQKPDILGPFTFYGVEGQAVLLDIEVFDSILDEIGLQYFWYDPLDTLISTDKKPILILENGNYTYKLHVKDPSGQISEANISVIIEDIAPTVFASNYRYTGVSGGILELFAYGLDTTYDIQNLDYYWTIYGTNVNNTYTGKAGMFEFECVNTTIYKAEVKVVDSSNKTGIISIIIDSFIDSNFNGFSDEVEARLVETGESIENCPDDDYDGLSNIFETNITLTNPNNNDTDNDGLCDGFDLNTGIGELTIGTHYNKSDTDEDGLLDGFEFFGWQITTEYYGNITVSSNPRIDDTDYDGLSDYLEFNMNTDPRNPDTDNDGLLDGIDPYPTKYDYDGDYLSDKVEYDLGTDIDGTDTDQDGLSDGEEVLGWGFKTNPLSADSDHDFLSDSSEIYTYTFEIKDRMKINKPISLLFDEKCEKASSAQISFTLSFGEYGSSGSSEYGMENVPDLYIEIIRESDKLVLFNSTSNCSRYFSKVIDIRDLIENNELDYFGTYSLRINNTIAGCILEEYRIEVSKYLDPNDDDTDDDKIMDGIECSLLVPGTKKLDFKDLYPTDNLTVDNDENTYDEFTLEIPYVGQVSNADLHVQIKGNEPSIGHGNVSIQLVKEEISNRIDDVVLIDSFEKFFDVKEIYYGDPPYNQTTEWYFDLSEYLENNIISEYYGNYKLRIQILENLFDNDTIYNNFTLVDYSININTYVEATSEDVQAWITDPGNWDTDGDGWSDYYEIFGRGGKEKMTNPLSMDTDGDGVRDSADLDPLYNIILEVTLKEGHIGDLPLWYLAQKNPPTMQLTADYKVQGEKKAYVSTHEQGTKDWEKITEKIKYYDFTKLKWRKKTITLAKWKGTAEFDQKFYIDIEDDNYNPKIKFKLWDEGVGKTDQYWDTLRKSCSFSEDLRGYSTGQEIPVYSGGTDRIKASVKKIGLEHATTIAVYGNGTVFNGHYNEEDSMHVIQIHVNDNPAADSPFNYGSNTIVIPNAVFLETKLNSVIQNETNDHEEFKNSILASGRFLSLDRENAPAKASGEVESVFIISCSAVDAQKILDLVLIGIINETTGELGVINEYTSSKDPCIRVETMNIPYHVLGLVPVINNYKNDEQGSMPMESGDWWAEKSEEVIDAVVGFFVMLWETIVNYIVKVFDAVLKVIAKVIEAIIVAIMWLIELLIKAILLALIWAMFAIILALFYVLMGAFITLIVFLNTFKTISASISENELKTEGFVNLTLGYMIGEKYEKGYDLTIPTLDVYVYTEDISMELIMAIFSVDIIVKKIPEEFFSDLFGGLSGQKSTSSQFNKYLLKENNEPTDEQELIGDIYDFFIGMWQGISLIGGLVGIQATLLGATSEPTWKRRIETAGIIMFVASFIIAMAIIFLSWEDTSPFLLFGYAVGCLIMASVLFKLGDYIGKVFRYMWRLRNSLLAKGTIIATIAQLFDFLFTIMDLGFNIHELILIVIDKAEEETNKEKFESLIFSLIAGVTSLFLTVYGITYLEKKYRDDKVKVCHTYGTLSILIASIFYRLGILRLLTREQ